MDTKQITEALGDIFDREKHRIVFWYDGEREFEEALPELGMEDVCVLRLDECSPLETKIRLEIEDTSGRYLLYAPHEEPAPENDWLIDIRLYSRTFHADRASIILSDLGLKSQALRPFIKKHLAFFRSADRLERLRKWIAPDDAEDDIAKKMLAVLVRAEQPELFSVLIKLYDDCCVEGAFDPGHTPRSWDDICKMGLEEKFWEFAGRMFAYDKTEGRSLADLITRILVTDFAGSLKGEPPTSVVHFILPENTGAMNTSVFLSQWRSHLRYHRQYRETSNAIAGKINAESLVSAYEPDDLVEVMTFEAVEKRIISALRDAVVENGQRDFKPAKEIINRRLDGYWAGAFLEEAGGANLYQTVYRALDVAMQVFDLRKKYDAGISYPDAAAMFKAYTGELFGFDQLYRVFNEYADAAEKAGWDVLKTLRESVENCYTGWFLENIGLVWGDFLDSDKGRLIDDWQIPGVCNQYRFFREYVAPVIKAGPKNRVFVIASDALRYEAAEEFARQINSRYRFKAEISAMLGVLPGYTALGMAALLPHDTLSFKDNGDVLADGKPTSTIKQRENILAENQGTAIKADDLMAMSKDQGRDYVKPFRVIYIFHDRIDATGDKASTEGETFHAVRRAIDDLQALVSFIINSLNGTRVIITADHGFIFHEKPAEALDKSSITPSGSGVVKTHKRFVMGRDLKAKDNVFSGRTRITAGTEPDMGFITPRGHKRFNFSGGARFFHGGAMPAEIVVPVVSVFEAKGRRLAETEVRKAGVSLLGTHKKIVSNIAKFKFIQTEPVSARVRPRVLKISLRDKTELISNEETVTFDSRSENVEDRTRSVKLNLKSGPFDSSRQYDLVLRHADDDTEYDRISLYIDLAFARDF
ncbi:MAG: BREX-1 system phosphatase PglZ type A [Desulfobacterales bacterium]